MRNRILATGAVLFALSAAPASAGGYGYEYGYYYLPSYHYSGVYRDPPPIGALYKHYLPDEDDFVPRYYYAPRYVAHYRHRKWKHRHHSHDYESRYDRRDPEYCDRLYRNAVSTDSRHWWRRYDRRCGD